MNSTPDSPGSITQRLVVGLGLETDQNAAAAEIEHRPLDHRRLFQHQRERLLLVDTGLGLVGQLAERRAGAVQERFPAGLLRPALQPVAVDAAHLVVMEAVLDTVLVEPNTGLLHGVAVLDAVDRDGHVGAPIPLPAFTLLPRRRAVSE